jgi:hypothetical protein
MEAGEAVTVSSCKPLGLRRKSKIGAGSIPEFGTYYVALLLVLIACLVPIWIVNYPGLTDYPNHLVRDYILAHYNESPLWQNRYSLDLAPIPNLAIDLFVVPLQRFLPLLVCGKLFLSLMAALYILGCSELGKAIAGKPNWLALACALTFYNTELLKGLVNYIFGVAVFLCAFAFWLRVRDRMTPITFLLCGLLSIVAFLSHLSSIVLLGVACSIISFLDFARHRKLIKLTINLAWLGFPILLTFGFLHGSGRIGAIRWSLDWKIKLIQLLSPFRSYNQLLIAAVTITLLVCFLVILKRSTIHPTWVVGAVFFFLFVVSPNDLFTASNVAERYVIPCYLVLLLSVEPVCNRPQMTAIAIALIALVIRIGDVSVNWLSIDSETKQVIAIGELLPEGASVFVLPTWGPGSAHEGAHPAVPEDRFLNMAQFWTVSRRADVSNLFALPGQQPLVFRQIACHGPYPPESDWLGCLGKFEFVWTVSPAAAYRQALAHIATPVATLETATLWRVDRTDAIGQESH